MQFGQIERIWFEDLPLHGSIDSSASLDLQTDEDTDHHGDADHPPIPLKSDIPVQPSRFNLFHFCGLHRLRQRLPGSL